MVHEALARGSEAESIRVEVVEAPDAQDARVALVVVGGADDGDAANAALKPYRMTKRMITKPEMSFMISTSVLISGPVVSNGSMSGSRLKALRRTPIAPTCSRVVCECRKCAADAVYRAMMPPRSQRFQPFSR